MKLAGSAAFLVAGVNAAADFVYPLTYASVHTILIVIIKNGQAESVVGLFGITWERLALKVCGSVKEVVAEVVDHGSKAEPEVARVDHGSKMEKMMKERIIAKVEVLPAHKWLSWYKLL